MCLKNVLNDTLNDLMCGPEKEENLKHILDFAKNLNKVDVVKEEENEVTKAILLIAEHLKETRAYMYTNPICKKKKPAITKVPPMKTRRQYGVIDMMHALVLIYCDLDVLRGYVEELTRRKHKTGFMKWVTFVLGKGLCCVIEGEWQEISKG